MNSELHTHVVIFPENDKGNVSVLSPSPHCGLTLDQICEKDIAKDKPFFHIHRDDLPEGGLIFHEAWRGNYEKEIIDVDMDVARELATDMVRSIRGVYFSNLDVLYQRASETQDTESMATVVEGKQFLRDLTEDTRIKTAETTGELLTALKEVESSLKEKELGNG